MPSNLKYHKDYIEFGETYQLVLPLNLEGLIPKDESVRLLSHELEELDYTLLYQAWQVQRYLQSADAEHHTACVQTHLL